MLDELTKLAKKYKTDKWGDHYYTPIYFQHFKELKNKKINLLEIGVGGYEDPTMGGESLRMWKDFFKNGNIFAIDIHDKSGLEEKRIKIFQGDQSDEAFLNNVVQKINKPIDIIIDDGSHLNNHVITSFKILFPLLKNGGIYVVEDLQTSYWERFGGDSYNLVNSNTSMNFFKALIDGLNHSEIENPFFKPNYFSLNIRSFHFYHNMVIIYKDTNNDPSNLNKRPETADNLGFKVKHRKEYLKNILYKRKNGPVLK